MPSFLSSTLSLCFILCVVAVIVMVFCWIEPNQVTFGVVTAVVSAYLTNYWNKPKQDTPKNEPDDLSLSKLEAYDPSDK